MNAPDEPTKPEEISPSEPDPTAASEDLRAPGVEVGAEEPAPAAAAQVRFTDETAEQNQLKNEVGHLSVEMLKAMLQTSVYSSDHPATQGVVVEPWRCLHALSDRFREITYMLPGGGDDDLVCVDGIFPKLSPLAEVIRTAMADHFAQKLSAYMHRHSIISVSIKTAIAQEEFERFVQVFVQRNLAEVDAERKIDTSFSDELFALKVPHVSVIGVDDLISKRGLPWRVRIAISRLRKDLRVVPMYAKSSRTELQAAKRLIVADIVRPLIRGDRIKDLLVNSDLIADEVEDLTGRTIEEDVISVLGSGQIDAVAWSLAEELQKVESLRARGKGPSEITLRHRDACKRNLRKVGLHLSTNHRPSVDRFLMHVFQHDLLAFEELPQPIREMILVERMTDSYLASPDQAFAELDQREDAEAYAAQLSACTSIVSELLRRRKYEDCCRIVVRIRRHAGDSQMAFPELLSFRLKALRHVIRPESLELMVAAFEKELGAERVWIVKLLGLLGSTAVPPLLALLYRSEDAGVRKDVCKAIVGTGPSGAEHVVRALARHPREWWFARNLINILAETRPEGAAKVIRPYLSHPQSRLKEEAIRALVAIEGEAVEPELLVMLDDADEQAQRRALVLLAALNSRHAAYMQRVVDILFSMLEGRGSYPAILAVPAIEAAVGLADVEVAGVGSMPELLAALVTRSEPSRLRRIIRGMMAPAPAPQRRALCDALARVGGEEALKTLARARRDDDAGVRDRAEIAIDAIRARLGMGAADTEAPELDPSDEDLAPAPDPATLPAPDPATLPAPDPVPDPLPESEIDTDKLRRPDPGSAGG